MAAQISATRRSHTPGLDVSASSSARPSSVMSCKDTAPASGFSVSIFLRAAASAGNSTCFNARVLLSRATAGAEDVAAPPPTTARAGDLDAVRIKRNRVHKGSYIQVLVAGDARGQRDPRYLPLMVPKPNSHSGASVAPPPPLPLSSDPESLSSFLPPLATHFRYLEKPRDTRARDDEWLVECLARVRGGRAHAHFSM
jgi:hypothetical protein